MCGWVSLDMARDSRSNRCFESELLERCEERILMATVRSSRVSRARYTSPIPPSPSGATISYGPSRVPGSNAMQTAHSSPVWSCSRYNREDGSTQPGAGDTMSEHKATIKWTHSSGDFLKGSYSPVHTWTFDGVVPVPASSSPAAVKVPYSNPSNVDPEEAYVASVSSCHMLTFLYVASRQGFTVTSYEDDAVGVMTKNERGATWVSSIVLHPRIAYAGAEPSPDVLEQLHHKAHDGCFIANSVKTEITVAQS